jgi:hypothetical protein
MNEELLKEMYDDMLDEFYPMVDIGNVKYLPSVALYRIDPIAYRVGMSDYESSLREEYESGMGYIDRALEQLFGDEEE